MINTELTPEQIRAELVARWSDPGRRQPFKGELIDFSESEPCMCAQGQALHYYGGWDFDRLVTASQNDADRETAKLLGISTAHAVLLRQVNDNADGAPQVVLANPSLVIGEQSDKILRFWDYLDEMGGEDWLAVAAAGAAAWDAAGVAARDAARDAAGVAARVAAGATNEIQGSAIMRERSRPFLFLPMFGFSSPERIK